MAGVEPNRGNQSTRLWKTIKDGIRKVSGQRPKSATARARHIEERLSALSTSTIRPGTSPAMAESKRNSMGAGSLNPAAASFSMPAPSEPILPNGPTQNTESAPTNGTGDATSSSRSNAQPETAARATTAENIAEAGAGVKLTGAQLKKQKAAEKAARRADKVAAKGEPAVEQQQAQSQAQAGPSGKKPEIQRRLSTTKKDGESSSHHRRTPSGRGIPIRGAVHTPQTPATPTQEKRHEVKRVAMFSHLYPREKKVTLASAGREIHPAVVSLGLQLRDYIICGGNARCVATMIAFKKVVQTYTTPSGVALSRHLLTHLNHQIAYLRNARPLSTSQGNAIRWLKNLISTQPVEAAEAEVKQTICQQIDAFIRDKVTLADEVIAREATSRIEDGDVVLAYAKSSVVEKTLLTAHTEGKKFQVIVADSRPMFEGKNLARSLIRAGVKVQYTLLSGLTDILTNQSTSITKCFLGASAMLGNGALLSRAGSAMVAMSAKEIGSQNRARKIPVIVLCETIKFTAKAALDSINLNEVGDPDALVDQPDLEIFTTPRSALEKENTSKPSNKASKQASGKPDTNDDDDGDGRSSSDPKHGLEAWKEQPNLFLLNLMYDVTPVEFLDLVICELGGLPPGAVPVVSGVHGDDQALA